MPAFGARGFYKSAAASDLITNGLVARWAMSEGSGSTIGDSSGFANDMTGVNIGAGDWVSGPSGGGAVDFDGSTEYTHAADDTAFDVSTEFTVLLWFAATGNQNDKHLIGHWDYPNQHRAWTMVLKNSEDNSGFGVQMSDDGTLNAGHRKNYAYQTDLQDGNWHHVAFRWGSSTLAFFLAGTEVAPIKVFDDAFSSVFQCDGPMMLATVGNDSTQAAHAAAKLSDTRIYNRALSDAEISNIANGTG